MHCVCNFHSDTAEQLLIPKDILLLIKDHCYHPAQHHFNPLPIVCHETACSGIKQQLSKRKLCPRWYTKHVANNTEFEAISIGLHISNDRIERLLSTACEDAESLPALSMTSRRDDCPLQQVRRIVFVDECPFTLQFVSMQQTHDARDEKLLSYPMMHVVVIDENESVNSVNLHCQRIWNATKCLENVLVFGGGKHLKVVDEVARFWNVPFVQADLLQFLVKYYWFRQLSTSSQNLQRILHAVA